MWIRYCAVARIAQSDVTTFLLYSRCALKNLRAYFVIKQDVRISLDFLISEKIMKLHTRLAIAAACFVSSVPVIASTTTYDFSGVYNVAGGSQAYNGKFSIVDPIETSIRPAYAADVTSPSYASIWSGTSKFYTGGIDLDITFASGAKVTASTFDIVVNNTTFQGNGAPYPQGLSVQLYPSTTSVIAPTVSVCDTPTGVCGEDDDPLYEDATQAAIMATTGVYFAFYNAPNEVSAGVPDLTLFGLNAGLGIFSTNALGQPTTTLTSFNSISATVTESPVPVPAAWMLMATGVLTFASQIRRNKRA